MPLLICPSLLAAQIMTDEPSGRDAFHHLLSQFCSLSFAQTLTDLPQAGMRLAPCWYTFRSAMTQWTLYPGSCALHHTCGALMV